MSDITTVKKQVHSVRSFEDLENSSKSGGPNFTGRLMAGAAVSSLAFQQSPMNELTRAYAGISTLEATGSPVLSAAAIGATTMFIETATGAISAYALRAYSDKLQKYREKINFRFSFTEKAQAESFKKGFLKDSAYGLLIGSAAVVARRHFYEKGRTSSEDNATVFKTSLGISAASLGIGYGAVKILSKAEGTKYEGLVKNALELAGDWETYAASVLAIGGMALFKSVKKPGDKQEITEHKINNEKLNCTLQSKETKKEDSECHEHADVHLDTDNIGIMYFLIHNDEQSDSFCKALEFEQSVWDSKSYGSLEEYKERYLEQTRLLAAFEGEECVATVRLISKGKSLPPFLSEMSFYEEKEKEEVSLQSINGVTEELATSAAKNDHKHRGIINNLWRLAFRDARDRGVMNWGIIMEPKRVKLLNKAYNLYFSQKGEEIEYQGGSCAAHMMNFEDAIKKMETDNSELLYWFIREPLKP